MGRQLIYYNTQKIYYQFQFQIENFLFLKLYVINQKSGIFEKRV
jgi:hypothetical protein